MDRPRLIVFCGLSGVGKSTASKYVAEACSAERYRSDEVRKELFDDPTYDDAETERTYEALLDRAQSELEAGGSVVLDATFSSERYRAAAADLAERTDADCTFVRVTCRDNVVKRRMEARNDTVSDATFETYLQQKERFDSLEREHVEIDNSGSVAEMEAALEEALL
ncbi:AAA family ATPase [Natronomonas gomsonensis]|uniref:AAA family ATPase n=1 Tax=Natronomonas gomsonensis TaxID=1046043 RepID=UPI0015B9C275|nr:AAA family ATPase [Natronomonas gomsonensis]